MTECNPCGMPDHVFKGLAGGLRILFSQEFETRLTLERVSRWLGVTPRTIFRWKKSRGFPRGKRVGKNPLSFSIDEVSEWVCRNRDVRSCRRLEDF